MNHQARVRDRKRKTYQEFLKWVNDPVNGVPENEEIEKSILREQWLQRAFDVFPEFKAHYNELVDEIHKVRLAQSKFNGTIVGEITGLSGRDLGIFMTNFINSLNKPKIEWALETSEKDIKQAILSWREHV